MEAISGWQTSELTNHFVWPSPVTSACPERKREREGEGRMCRGRREVGGSRRINIFIYLTVVLNSVESRLLPGASVKVKNLPQQLTPLMWFMPVMLMRT